MRELIQVRDDGNAIFVIEISFIKDIKVARDAQFTGCRK